MTYSNSASDAENSINLLGSFAQSQLASVDPKMLHESLIAELVVCAFFWGAEAQLRKQSQLDPLQCQKELINIIRDACATGEFQTVELINSIEELAGKYYLLENIAQQGEAAADQWLSCEDVNDDALLDLVNNYHSQTLSELGIEGLNKTFSRQQERLYQSVDRSVAKIRFRALVIFLLLVGTGILTALVVTRINM